MTAVENRGILLDASVKRMTQIVALIIFIAVCAGCSIGKIREQSQAIGSMGIIKGRVNNTGDQQGTVIVFHYVENNGVISLESRTQINALGEYLFNVFPGIHYIAAFIDGNLDGAYQAGEHANYYGKPTGISVAAGQTVTLDELAVSGELPAMPVQKNIEDNLSLIFANIGRVVHLDDPIFSRDNYSLGMWRPMDFLTQVGGGLMFLQDYEQDKIPVLFIHGVNGGPTDMKTVIERLDRNRFQPWVLYYPSGMRLNMVSDYLVKAVATLQSRFRFNRYIVIAHSMGGLVTRSFVKKYGEQYPDRMNNLLMAMTVNSPMGGMPSAARGLRSPVTIQCWIDVVPGSDFLNEINSWKWPESVPYYLVFSFESGKGDDGVVPVERQIPLNLQEEAMHVYGFNNSHVGTLKDDTFLSLFDVILASTGGE
jgi:pimeloyl-ACP methyl ester carboxylesterase